MTPAVALNPYKRHRFPDEIMIYAVWLYYRLSLSP
jgi:transposase-like protein